MPGPPITPGPPDTIPAARKIAIMNFLLAKGHAIADLRKQAAWAAGKDAQPTDSDVLRNSLCGLHGIAGQYRDMYQRIVGK